MDGRGRWVLTGVAGLVVLGLLVTMVSELQTSRQHIESQDSKASLQLEILSRLSQDSGPVLDSGRRILAPLTRNRSDLRRTLTTIPPLAGALVRAVDSSIPVLKQLEDGGIVNSLQAIGPVLDRAQPALRQAASPQVDELADRSLQTLQALKLQSLRRVLNRGARLSNQALSANLLGRLNRTTRDIQAVLEVQRSTRKLQREALGIQRESLDVQHETLKHAASLDRKLGGETIP